MNGPFKISLLADSKQNYYLGTNHTTHAVYFRNYSKHLTDFSGGFWYSQDTYPNVTPNIAVKCRGPTQQKYPCWENLHKGISESIWKCSKRRINKNKSKVKIPQHQRKTGQMFSWGHMDILPLLVSKAVPNIWRLFLTAVCSTCSVKSLGMKASQSQRQVIPVLNCPGQEKHTVPLVLRQSFMHFKTSYMS